MTKDNLPAKIDRAFEKVSEIYGEELVPIRAAINMVPFIGSGIDMILASEGQRAAKRRLNVLLREMKNRMEQLEEGTVDKEYLESEEFIDLVIKGFESAIRTRDEKKIRLYARILTESTVRDKREQYSPEGYLYLISDLTPLELRVARSLYETKPEKRKEPWEAWQQKACGEIGIDRTDVQLALSRLNSSGLIVLIPSSLRLGEPKPDDVPYYVVSSSFEKLMEFLEPNS